MSTRTSRHAVVMILLGACLAVGQMLVSDTTSGGAQPPEEGVWSEGLQGYVYPDGTIVHGLPPDGAVPGSIVLAESRPTDPAAPLPTTQPEETATSPSPETQPGGLDPAAGAAGLASVVLPTIIVDPQSQSLCPGKDATLTVLVLGASAYQWQKDGTDLTDGGRISGSQSFELRIVDVESGDAGNYRCVTSNDAGSATSADALLTVDEIRSSDFDRDCDVDRNDLAQFEACATAPGVALLSDACRKVDLDGDGDVDQADFSLLQRSLTQSSEPGPMPPIEPADEGDPVADAGGPYAQPENARGPNGWTFAFDGSASTSQSPLVSYEWDFGADSFDGYEIDTSQYYASGVTLGDGKAFVSGGMPPFGSGYLFNRQVHNRAPDAVAQARIVPSQFMMAAWGLKDTSTNYSYTTMQYAIMFYMQSLVVYENGSSRGTVGTVTPDQPYDVRIVLKGTTGARYYGKPADVTGWTLLYDSNFGSATEFLVGGCPMFAMGDRGLVLDEQSLRFYGPTLARTVTGPTSVTFTVTDSVGRSDSETVPVEITGQPPVAAGGGIVALTEGDLLPGGTHTVIFDGSGSTDDYGITQYLWDFGTQTFDGTRLNLWQWRVGPQTYQEDALILYASWGDYAPYAFTQQPVSRVSGQAFECRVHLRSVYIEYPYAAFGFKDMSSQYGLEQMAHALYISANGLHILEDGIDRGAVNVSPCSFSSDEPCDVRIVLKEPAGATYWIRSCLGGGWSKVYDSTTGTATQMLRGILAGRGNWEIDNFRDTSAGSIVSYRVTGDTTATLTVSDMAGRTATVQKQVTITGAPPLANPGGPYVVPVGASVFPDGSGSTDDYRVVRYDWDWGDPTNHVFSTPGLYTASLTVEDVLGHQNTATTTVQVVPMAVCVPWLYDPISGREIPHNTWDGKDARLKGVVFTDTPVDQLTYTWDFGDGSPPDSGAVTDKRVIEAAHIYNGDPGALYTAILTVQDPVHGDLADTYPVEIHTRDLKVEVNVAIDEGLWWLHKQQYADASWGSPWWKWSPESSTASCIHAMEINGHAPSRGVAIDPLVDDVCRALRFLFARLRYEQIGPQPYGDPDSNGNGLGITVTGQYAPYQGGQVMDALAASGLATAVTDTGDRGVRGRSFRDIAQDMADMYSWGQVDSGNARGGWQYAWNAGSDNSACQWAAIGYLGIKSGFGIDAPAWVKAENEVWLNYSHNPLTGTFGYTAPNAGGGGVFRATTPSGLVQLAFNGKESSDPRWQAAEAWIANNWSSWIGDPWNDSVYAWYSFAKAMRLALPKPVTSLSATGLDWYYAPTGLAPRIVSRQLPDGSWPDSCFALHACDEPYSRLGNHFTTAWQLVILTPSLFTRPPVAVAGDDIVWVYDRPLVFDGSKSYHSDRLRVLVTYEWDFDGDGTYEYIGTDPVVEHTYPFQAGATYPINYTTRLRVTDDMGQLDTDTRVVTIVGPPHAPLAVIGGPYTASVGASFRPDAGGSLDVDPTDYITRQEWDFDSSDGYNFDTPDAAVDCPAPPGTCPPVTWVFNTPGVYNIGLRVWDNAVLHPQNQKLASVPDYTTVTVVENQPPVADAGGPYEVTECTPLQLDGSASSDPLGDALTYAWDLDGDGEFDDSTSPAPLYTWPGDGTFTVSLIVSDGTMSSQPSTAQVTVLDAAPTITLNGPDTLEAGQEGFYEASIQSACDSVALVEWDWDYDGVVFSPSGQTGPAVAHVFDGQGTFTVAVRVTDEDGSTALATLEVIVTASAGPRVPAGKRIKVIIGRRDYDAARKIHRAMFTLVSEHDQPIRGPVVLAFDNIVPPAVNLVRVDGQVRHPTDPTRTMPYVDFSDLLTDNTLSPGQSIGPRWIEFNDPDNAAFTFEAIPYLYNTAPKITSSPVLTAGEGQRYRYDVEAIDDDGDPVRFALRATAGVPAPQGMTVHPLVGLIDWVPGQSAAGSHDVTVVALDGYVGGEATQTFQIAVGAVNVPPVITSTPETTWKVGLPYRYVVQASDPDGDPVTCAVLPADLSTEPCVVGWTPTTPGRQDITVTVSDDQSHSTSQQFVVTVLTCDDPPVIHSVPVTTATEGQPYSYQVAATGEGELAYTLPVAPQGMTIGAAGLITWTPGYSAHGPRTVKVVAALVSNPDCRAEQVFQIDVADVNAPPQITSTPVTNAAEGVAYRYAVTAVDPDGDAVGFRLVEGPTGMTIHPLVGLVEWTPSQTAAASSPYTITVEASDPLRAADRQTFELIVAIADEAPRITSSPVYAALEEHLYEYDVEAVDPDNDVLAYSLVTAPVGMTIDAASGLIHWTPGPNAAGGNPHVVHIVVSDPGGHTATQVYEVFARAFNSSPVITSEPVTTVVEGQLYRYLVTATDSDGDSLTYGLSVSPGGMNIHRLTGQIDWLVPQTAAADSPHDVIVTVTDGMATVEQPFAITAEAVNVAPVVASPPVVHAAVGAAYQYDVEANDPDGDVITYSLGDAPTGMAIDPASGLITWEPAIGQDGNQHVRVVVSDPAGLTGEQSFVITVDLCPDAPKFTSSPKLIASPDSPYSYQATATVIRGTVSFSLATFPQGMTIGAASGLVTWTPTDDQMGSHEVVIVATRDGVCSNQQSFQVEVKECELTLAYAPPVLVPGQAAEFTPDVTSNCEPLAFELISGPAGMTVSSSTGVVRWVPVLGPFTAEVRCTDAWGTVALAVFNGDVRPQSPPRIISVPLLTARVNAPYSYLVEAVDDDGDALEYALVTAPVGMTLDPDTHEVTWLPGTVALGTHHLAVRVFDARGAMASQPFGITVSTTGNNHAPRITSPLPPDTAYAGFPYVHDVEASDEDGDTLTYSLQGAPAGMSIDPNTGLIEWEPTPAHVGVYVLKIRATDPQNGWDEQSLTLTAKVNTPPQIVSVPLTKAIATLAYEYDVQAVDPDEPQLLYALAEAPEGMTIDENTGVISWTPTVEQVGDHSVNVVVRDSLAAEATQPFTVTVYADKNADLFPPEVAITADPRVVNPGEPVTITVQATDDFFVVSLALTVNDEEVTLDLNGRAIYTPAAAGPYVAEATAKDLAGQTRKATTDFYARTPGDITPPSVAITAPEADAQLKVPTDIVGTASDDNLYRYTLAHRPIGEDGWTDFAVGYTSVTDGILGRLDTTLMMNGLYEVRLRAEDTNGNMDEVVLTYSIGGGMKVGNFSISFTDLQVPVSGIPITVTRTYDSRNKTKGDFGMAWTMDIASLRIEENGTLGQGWEQDVIDGFFPQYVLRPVRPHIVSFTLPDGRVERFEAEPVPSQQMLYPITYINGINFKPIYPATSTLRATGELPDYYDGDVPGRGSLLTMTGEEVSVSDPTTYELTQVDGTVLTFVGNWHSRTARLQSIRDRNGNTLQFTAGGVTHSAGRSITFDRDAENRITTITDPNGDQILYEYDDHGDLVAVTDQDGKLTEFLYDLDHYLVEIISSDGQQVARNIYDDEGRLIGVVDSDGNRREIEHDLNNRVEVVRDALGHPTIYEYDGDGNVSAETDALDNRTDYSYDDRGNRLTKTDALGNTTTWTYDADNNKLSETDPLGNTRHWTYNARNQITSEVDALGNTTTHEYDSNGNLTGSRNGLGEVSTYTYGTRGELISTSDPLGNVTSYAYDHFGNRLQKTDALGNVITWTHDANGNPLTETRTRTTAAGPVSMTTTKTHNAQGLVTSTTDSLGNVDTTEYHTSGQMTAFEDKNGRRTEREYGALAKSLTRILFPDGSELNNTYDAQGNLVGTRDRDGHTTVLAYDVLNRQTHVIDEEGNARHHEYDKVGRLEAVIDADGNRTEFEYDAAGRQTRAIDALFNETVKAYDANGNVTSVTDPNLNTTRFEYDPLNRLTRTIHPNGTSTTIEYECGCSDRKSRVTDQSGRTTRYEYNRVGWLTKVIDARGAETTYTYDEVGDRLTQTDAEGRTTRMEYDDLGRLTKRILPLGQEEHFAYDAVGHVTEHVDFNGDTIADEYDENNRLTLKLYPDGSTTGFAYRPSGRRAQAGGDTYEYDDLGLLMSEAKAGGEVISYTYDAAGNRTSVTTSEGTVTYAFDTLNRLETVTDLQGGVTTYTYDAVGNRASLTYPNGTRANYTYDTLNRLTYLENAEVATGDIISSYTYTLDLAGNRTRVVEHSGRTVDYEYDDLYRLTKETINEPASGTITIAYTYDAVGNRLSMVVQSLLQRREVRYTYDANDRLLTEQETITLAGAAARERDREIGRVKFARASHYGLFTLLGVTAASLLTPCGLLLPARGVGRRVRRRRFFVITISLLLLPCMIVSPENVWALQAESALYQSLGPMALADTQTSKTITYTYDDNGNMLSRSDGVNMTTYGYDYENRLVRFTDTTGTTTYAYDADGNRISKTDTSGTTTYLVDTNNNTGYTQVLAEIKGSDVVTYVYGDDLISMRRPDTGTSCYHYDGQMSTRQLTSASGIVSDTYAYDAFGTLLDSTGSTVNNYRYAGEQYDPNVGFHYLRARYYDPTIGRFCSADSFPGIVADPASLHKYAYVHGNPVMHRDPSGRSYLGAMMITVGVVAVLLSILFNVAQMVKGHGSYRDRYDCWGVGQFLGGILGFAGAVGAFWYRIVSTNCEPGPAREQVVGDFQVSMIGVGVGYGGGASIWSTSAFSAWGRKITDFSGLGFAIAAEAEFVVPSLLIGFHVLPEGTWVMSGQDGAWYIPAGMSLEEYLADTFSVSWGVGLGADVYAVLTLWRLAGVSYTFGS